MSYMKELAIRQMNCQHKPTNLKEHRYHYQAECKNCGTTINATKKRRY